MSRIFDDHAQSMGNTPLVRLHRVAGKGVTVLAKVEGRNPTSSVKCHKQVATPVAKSATTPAAATP